MTFTEWTIKATLRVSHVCKARRDFHFVDSRPIFLGVMNAAVYWVIRSLRLAGCIDLNAWFWAAAKGVTYRSQGKTSTLEIYKKFPSSPDSLSFPFADITITMSIARSLARSGMQPGFDESNQIFCPICQTDVRAGRKACLETVHNNHHRRMDRQTSSGIIRTNEYELNIEEATRLTASKLSDNMDMCPLAQY